MNALTSATTPYDRAAGITTRSAALRAEAIEHHAWDRLLARFDDVTFEQSAMYASHRWGRDNVLCFVVRDGSEAVLGGAVVTVFRIPLLGGLGYLRFGPVWRARGAHEPISKYERVIEAIRTELAARGLAMTVMPRPHPHYPAQEAEALHRLGFVRARDMVDADRYMVDAALPADEQMASLAQTWRANLRKAEKAELEIRDLDYSEYGEFVALYNRMTERKQVTLYGPVEVVPALRDHLPEDMHPKIMIARHNGEAVAGVVYAFIGDIAYYMFGATGDKALPLRAGYALQWAVLERLRGLVGWYDLGGAPEGGLRQFKSGLVGKRGVAVHMPGEFDHASGIRARLALNLIFGLRAAQRIVRRTVTAIRRQV